MPWPTVPHKNLLLLPVAGRPTFQNIDWKLLSAAVAFHYTDSMNFVSSVAVSASFQVAGVGILAAVAVVVLVVEEEVEKSLQVVVASLPENVGHTTFPKPLEDLRLAAPLMQPVVTEDINHQVMAADCTLVAVVVAATWRLVVNMRDCRSQQNPNLQRALTVADSNYKAKTIVGTWAFAAAALQAKQTV